MLRFESHNLEDLEAEAKLKATEISIEILKGICTALDENADAATFAFMSNIDMDISVERENYLDALLLNFSRVEAAEEFELCARATKWIEILKRDKEV